MQTPSGPKPGPLAWSVEEAAERLGVGRTSVYALIRNGAIRTVQIGRRRLIPESELQRMMTKLLAQDLDTLARAARGTATYKRKAKPEDEGKGKVEGGTSAGESRAGKARKR